MLSRWAVAVWVAWLSLIGLSGALVAGQVWNPNPILPVGLMMVLVGAGIGLVNASRPFRAPFLEVEECRFGPIPEAEFAVAPFLARFRSNLVYRPVKAPATAMMRNGFWLGFVLGGVSLAVGVGLAVRNRSV